MIKLLTILSLLFLSFSCLAQSADSSKLFREEIRTFFASVQPLRGDLYISDKQKNSITAKTISIFFPHDTIFSKADLAFIDRQVAITENFRWDSSVIDKRILIKDTDVKSKERYISYSAPAFSLDFQICILFVDMNCNLATCGEGSILILKKRNGVWEVIDGEMTWTS